MAEGKKGLSRRDFLKTTGIATGAVWRGAYWRSCRLQC